MVTSDDIVLIWCSGFQKRTACLPPVFWSNRTLAVSRANSWSDEGAEAVGVGSSAMLGIVYGISSPHRNRC
jgi:hypothetical protein